MAAGKALRLDFEAVAANNRGSTSSRQERDTTSRYKEPRHKLSARYEQRLQPAKLSTSRPRTGVANAHRGASKERNRLLVAGAGGDVPAPLCQERPAGPGGAALREGLDLTEKTLTGPGSDVDIPRICKAGEKEKRIEQCEKKLLARLGETVGSHVRKSDFRPHEYEFTRIALPGLKYKKRNLQK